MAKTLSYVQEHGYNTVEDVEGKLSEIKEFVSSKKELKDIEGRLQQVNERCCKISERKTGAGKLPTLQTLKAEKEKLHQVRPVSHNPMREERI